jgi:hypothetical protein
MAFSLPYVGLRINEFVVVGDYINLWLEKLKLDEKVFDKVVFCKNKLKFKKIV